MENFGFIRVAACSPEVKPGNVYFNTDRISENVRRCVAEGAKVVLFPELSITGYTCADLFGQSLLIDSVIPALDSLARQFAGYDTSIVVGAPIRYNGCLYNCAAVIGDGRIQCIVPKTYLPNYGEFYEKRWFTSGENVNGSVTIPAVPDNSGQTGHEEYQAPISTSLLFETHGVRFGIEICEDLWVPNPPSSALSMSGADIILNLSATNELIGKHRYLVDLIRNQSARCRCGYVYASAGTGESSTDLAFAGNCIIAENGSILAHSERFMMGEKRAFADLDIESLRHDRTHFGTFHEGNHSPAPQTIRIGNINYANTDTDSENLLKYRKIKAHPFLDENPEELAERCDEISSIQAWGLATRLRAIHCTKAIVGISGGLDSTLALLVTVKAFDMLGLDRKGIIGITMPGFGTTDRTKSNATELMEQLGVTDREITIGQAVKQHFSDIGHNPAVHDVTYENSQARERTQILMDVANQENGIVIGTGDLSELALGWCTYNGDQMSMYGVNASIPKTLVKYLVGGYESEALERGDKRLAEILRDIINTPISPELLPPDENDNIEQKTEDLVGPYELHDFFIYHMLRFGSRPKKIEMLANRAFAGKYDSRTIRHWLRTFYRRFFNQQFKRSCMPDGVKPGSVCLSPRGDWRMPSDASSELWLRELDEEK